MARQDFWNRQRGRERSWDVRDLREDFGQADYSRDYIYDRRRRIGYRAEPNAAGRDDFGQADFSRDYEYDPRRRTAVRREELHEQLRDERPRQMRDDADDRGWRRSERAVDRERRREEPHSERRLDDPRTWFGGGARHDRDRDGRDDRFERDRGYEHDSRYQERDRYARGRGGDEALWRAVMDRLTDDRRLDARDIQVDVRDGEVTLRGVVEDRDQKRRAEDLADISGVVDVHNHLTIRDRYAGERQGGSSWRRNLGLDG